MEFLLAPRYWDEILLLVPHTSENLIWKRSGIPCNLTYTHTEAPRGKACVLLRLNDQCTCLSCVFHFVQGNFAWFSMCISIIWNFRFKGEGTWWRNLNNVPSILETSHDGAQSRKCLTGSIEICVVSVNGSDLDLFLMGTSLGPSDSRFVKQN